MDCGLLLRTVRVADVARPIVGYFDDPEDYWSFTERYAYEESLEGTPEVGPSVIRGGQDPDRPWRWTDDGLIEFAEDDEQKAKIIQLTQLVSADMPVEDMLVTMCTTDHELYFMLSGNQVTHWLDYRMLVAALPFRIALLALLLGLEELLTEWITYGEAGGRNLFESLPERRRQDACRTLETRTLPEERSRSAVAGRGTWETARHYAELVNSTSLMDKWKMLQFNGIYQLLMPFTTKTEGNAFFLLARNIRNAIAHGQRLELAAGPCEFTHLIDTAKAIAARVNHTFHGDESSPRTV